MKSHLIVKCQYLEAANVIFGNSIVNLTSEGMQHLGAVIGNYFCKESYVSELVNLKQSTTTLVKNSRDRATITICSIC